MDFPVRIDADDFLSHGNTLEFLAGAPSTNIYRIFGGIIELRLLGLLTIIRVQLDFVDYNFGLPVWWIRRKVIIPIMLA
jgi:hypothetical protein